METTDESTDPGDSLKDDVRRTVTTTAASAADAQSPNAQSRSPFLYPRGLGPLLINHCTATPYPPSSPCHGSSLPAPDDSICSNMIESASAIGMGFDARGYYSADSGKGSLLQRLCSNGAEYRGQDLPDNVKVLRGSNTEAKTRSFASVAEYMRYIRGKAGLSDARGIFSSEESKYKEASADGAAAGGIITAYASGEQPDAQQDAAAGDNIGNKRADKNVSPRSFFSVMYVNIIMYRLELDEVKPTDLSLDVLSDYMNLPSFFYSVGAEVKYQDFLLRYGTHYTQSAKIGGQLKIIKTLRTDKTMTPEEFARLSEAEFRSMFAVMQSSFAQKSNGDEPLGFHGDAQTSSDSGDDSEQSDRRAQAPALRPSEFTQTSLEALGGKAEIAQALVDFYTPAFNQRFYDWLVSISSNPEPFDLKLRSIVNLFDLKAEDLFPQGDVDFGCIDGAGGKVQIQTDPDTNKRFYNDTRVIVQGDSTIEENVKVYCKYANREEFGKDLKQRKLSLERAIDTYLVEGPLPASSYDLPAGEVGCAEVTVNALRVSSESSAPLKYLDLQSAPFLLAFNIRMSIRGIASMNAKFKVVHNFGRWFAISPRAKFMQLYEGCDMGDSGAMEICFRNIIFTYDEDNGVFYVTPQNFAAAKLRIPSLPDWLSGLTVARATTLQPAERISDDIRNNRISVPCNVQWRNSYRFDPSKEENCIHFSAATKDKMFVIFASVPRKDQTWYYLQIDSDGVSFYKGFELEKRVSRDGWGTAADADLFQPFFVCVIQRNDSVLMQYGKPDPDSEIGPVYASYKAEAADKFNPLSFYSFGSGEKSVSIREIKLMSRIPEIECLDIENNLVNGFCDFVCHEECNGCRGSWDNTVCIECQNVRLQKIVGDKTVTECLPECPAGYQLSDDGSNLCVLCPAGTYKNVVGNQLCTPCPTGAFGSAEGATECSLCAAGTFTDVVGQTQCQNCTAGKFSAEEGSSNCELCAKGHISAAGQTQCDPCAVGQYADEMGLAECKPCAAGSYAASAGSPACDLCDAGSYQPSAEQTACILAAKGSFVAAAGATAEDACPADTFAANEGQSACDPCPAGTGSQRGAEICENNCEVGMFSPQPGIACAPCAAGSYAANFGSSACDLCELGMYQPSAGQSGCIAAPKGSYVPTTGATGVTNCPAGTFNSLEGQSEATACEECPAGTVSTGGAGVCTPCSPGYYQSLTGQSSCVMADRGHYAAGSGSAEQQECPPGKFAAQEGQSFCASCGIGEFSDEASDSCSKCKAGFFAPASGEGACTPCPGGEYSSSEGASSCSKCAVGTFADGTGNSRCYSCPHGSYTTSVGASECTSCSGNPDISTPTKCFELKPRGCFQFSETETYTSFDSLTKEVCAQFCAYYGYKNIALHLRWCYCTSSSGGAASGGCNASCAGRSTETCGGDAASSVYSICEVNDAGNLICP